MRKEGEEKARHMLRQSLLSQDAKNLTPFERHFRNRLADSLIPEEHQENLAEELAGFIVLLDRMIKECQETRLVVEKALADLDLEVQ